MENKLCFDIKELKCSYEKESSNPKVVLEIDKLEIHEGEVVFFVGRSGCGKSTILETLGLMNDTILEAEEFKIYPDKGVEIDGTKVWKLKNKEISNIRKQYFSFIFQETNLMRNFSIRENAEIAKLVKGGNREYKDIISEVFPDDAEANEILGRNKKKDEDDIGKLSGGQRQRLAFARAFMPDFKILFCDEPTGNLDPENADVLMNVVSDEIKNTDKVAIIVSHSPELSLKYADCIINIRTIKDDNLEVHYGKIDSNSVYQKKDNGKWIDSEQKELTDVELKNIIWPNNGKVF